MSRHFDNRPEEPRASRVLSEVPLPFRDQATSAPRTNEEIVASVLDDVATGINRATVLIREVEPRARKVVVPVDVDAVPVRAAIRRQRPQMDGSFITFDLYKDMIDKQVERVRTARFEVLGELTGNVLTDGYKIKREFSSGGKGLSSWDEFLLNMEPWLLWLLLNQLIGQHQCQEHTECTAAKQPPGTEAGPIAMRYAISIAAMMLIMGMREEHILFAVNNPNNAAPLPSGDLIKQARRLIESDQFSRQVADMLGSSDPQMITSYVEQYILRKPIGYEDWIAYRDLRVIREEASVIYIHAHQYSGKHRQLLDYSSSSTHRTPTAPSGFPNPLGTSPNVTVVDPSSYAPPSNDVLSAFQQHAALLDRDVGAIAGVLTSGFGMDLLCCFGRFMGAQDIERLKKIRHLIRALQGAMVGTAALNVPSPAGVVDWLLGAVQQRLIAELDKLLQKGTQDILDWIAGMDTDLVRALEYCPLLYDVLDYAIQSINNLSSRLLETIRQYIIRVEGIHGRTFRTWGSIYDSRRASTILSILDRLIAGLEACSKPGADDVVPTNPGEDPSLFAGVPKPLVLPKEVMAKFFPNPTAIPRGEGLRPIPPVGQVVSATNDPVSLENFRTVCRGIMPDQLIEAALKARNPR